MTTKPVTVVLKSRTVSVEISQPTVHLVVPLDTVGAPQPGTESSGKEGG